MADKNIQVAVILSAQDRMSAIISSAVNKSQARMRAMAQASVNVGKSAATVAGLTAAALYKPIGAYADQEDAALRLRANLMSDGGVVNDSLFKKLNDQAIELGNKLPGTTADFQRLYSVLLKQNVNASSILDGVGKSAAYLAVQMQMPTDEAGRFAARLRNTMGVANKDMMGFMDVINRTNMAGVLAPEMEYFFSRAAGGLKLLKVQGLDAAKTMGVLGTMLIRDANMPGEVAGTSLNKILNELMNPTKIAAFNATAKQYGLGFQFFKDGKFLGLENFIAQWDKLKGFDPQTISKILLPLTGGDGADNSFLANVATMGVEKFNANAQQLARFGTMTKMVDSQLESLQNQWESTSGTFTNTMAAWVTTFAPTLKLISRLLNSLAISIQNVITKYPNLSKWIGLAAIAMVGLATAVAITTFSWGGLLRTVAVSKTIWFGVGNAVMFLGRGLLLSSAYVGRLGMLLLTRGIPAMATFTATVWANAAAWLANPATYIILAIIAAVAALAAAAYLIYKNWTPITEWFSKQWINMKAQVAGLIGVFKLFGDVLIGVGKAYIGAFTFNPKLMVEGAKQAATAIKSISNGGISKAYTLAHDQSVKESMANGGKATNKPFVGIRPSKSTSNTSVTHFSPQITVQGGAAKGDGKMMMDEMKPLFLKWQKEQERNKVRTAY